MIKKLSEEEEQVWSLFRGATWWIPLADSFLFQGPLPTGQQTIIGTIGGLRNELEKLNSWAWQADEDTIRKWSQTEGYPVDGEVGPDGVFVKSETGENIAYDTESLAKFAFSLFYQALIFAEEQQVPILLDY